MDILVTYGLGSLLAVKEDESLLHADKHVVGKQWAEVCYADFLKLH